MSAAADDRRAPPPEEGAEPDPAMARAEELVDQMGERFGQFLSQAGHYAQKAMARAREEAEDIWAEAQEMRRNG
jgi:hypothetical protein